MSGINPVDISSLEWIQPEIETSLKKSANLIELYEREKNTTALRKSLAHIHAVRGSLDMIEPDAAARVAEAMEALLQRELETAQNGRVSRVNKAGSIGYNLHIGTVGLSHYLKQLSLGEGISPLTLLPAINRLRNAIDAEPFAEIELFKPDLNLSLPGANDFPGGGKGLNKAVIERLREHFQKALLHFIRRPEEVAPAHIMRDIAGGLARNAKPVYVRKLWSIANAFLGLLPTDAQHKPAYKLLAGRLDAPLRTLATHGERALTPTLYNNRLLRELLLEIARSEQKSESLEQIRSIFSLHAWIGKNPAVPVSSTTAHSQHNTPLTLYYGNTGKQIEQAPRALATTLATTLNAGKQIERAPRVLTTALATTLNAGKQIEPASRALATALATTLLDWEQNRSSHASALKKRLESVIQFCSEKQNPQIQQLATQSAVLLTAINTKPDRATPSVLATLSRTIHRVIHELNSARQVDAVVNGKVAKQTVNTPKAEARIKVQTEAVTPVIGLIAASPVSQPVAAKPVSQPAATKPVSQPAAAKPVSRPAAAKPVSQPVAAKPASQPAAAKPVSRPAAAKPVSQSAAAKPVSQPAAAKPVSRPATAKPVSQPAATKPVSRPAAAKPVSRPATAKPVSRSVAAKPVSQPAATKPVSRPAAAKPVQAETPAVSEDLIQKFNSETEKLLGRVNALRHNWSRKPGDNAIVKKLSRVFCTLRGWNNLIHEPEMSSLAASCEDLLEPFVAGTRATIADVHDFVGRVQRQLTYLLDNPDARSTFKAKPWQKQANKLANQCQGKTKRSRRIS